MSIPSKAPEMHYGFERKQEDPYHVHKKEEVEKAMLADYVLNNRHKTIFTGEVSEDYLI